MKLFPTSFMLTFLVAGILICDSSARVRGIHKKHLVTDAVTKALHVPIIDEHFRVLKAGDPAASKMPAESSDKESKTAKQDKKKNKSVKKSGEKKKPKKGAKDSRGAKPKALHEEAQLPGGGEEEDQLENTTRAAKMGGGKAGKQSVNMDEIEETVNETAEEFDGVLSVEDTSVMFDEADTADPEITKRSLTLLAIQYDTSSNQIPASLDYIELARVTRHLLSNLFHWYYGNFQNIKYDLLEMHRYTVLAPTLVKFDVTLHFQEGDGVFVPTQADIQAAIDEQLYEGSDYANLYLNRLRNNAFGIFTTTTSFRVVTNGNDLEQLEEDLNEKQGIDDFSNDSGPSSWINLVALVALLVLSLLLCVALCTCYRRRRRRSQRLERNKRSERSRVESRDPTDPENDSTTGISEYRTNMFSDQEASLRSLQITPQDDENKLQNELDQVMDALEDVPLDEIPRVEPAGVGNTPTNRPKASTDPPTTDVQKISYHANQAVTTPGNKVETQTSKSSWAVKANMVKPKFPESTTAATSDSIFKATKVQKKDSPVAPKPTWVVKSQSQSSASSYESIPEPVHSGRGTESAENTLTVPTKPAWARKSSTESDKSDHLMSTNATIAAGKKLYTPPKPTWAKTGSSSLETSEIKSDAGETNDEGETVDKTSHALTTKSSLDTDKCETSELMDKTKISFSSKPIWASKNFLKPVNRDGSGQNRLWAKQEADFDPPLHAKETAQGDSGAADADTPTTSKSQKKGTASAECVVTDSKESPPVPQTFISNVSSEEESKICPQHDSSPHDVSLQKEEQKNFYVSIKPNHPSIRANMSTSVKPRTAVSSPVGSLSTSFGKLQTNTSEKSTETIKKTSISISSKPEAEDKPASESDEPAVVASGSAPEWMTKFKQMGLQKSEE